MVADRPDSSETIDHIDWQPWGADAFERAEAEGRLILLSGAAHWCADCRALNHGVLADRGILRLVREQLLPVRFDADRLPHVRDRYNAGGWPIIALLTPAGEILWIGSPSTAHELESVTERVLDAWTKRREEIDREIERRRMAAQANRKRRGTSGIIRRESADDVLTAAQQTFDDRNGGWGESPKYLPPDAVVLLYVAGARHDNPDWARMASHTLDGVAAGELHDKVAGGFFRMAHGADWTTPSTEKLLEANAWALRAFAFGAHVEDRPDRVRIVEDTVAWADRTLRLPNGLWGGSQAADPEYYARPADERAGGDAPAVDNAVFTDACAEWIAALAEAGGRLGRTAWVEDASAALTTLLDRMDAGDGLLYHYREADGTCHTPGLLSDVVEAGRACLAVAQATGQMEFVRHARRLAETLRGQFWAEDGGFEDLVEGCVERTGALRYHERPFELNAVAAGFLVDLTLATEERSHRALAERTLALLSPMAGRYGVNGATFALATEHFFEPPTRIVIAGAGEGAGALRQAALALPVADRQVWSLPEGGSIGGRRIPVPDEPVVHVCGQQRWSQPIDAAAGLGEAVAAAG